MNSKGKLVVWSVVGVIVLILFLWAIDIVPTGRTQIVTRFGKVVRTNGEGLAFHVPMVERTKSIDTTIRRETAQAAAATSNLQNVNTKVSINYRISRESAVKQYQNFTKKDFVGIIVQPKLQDSIKAVAPTYTAEALVLQRANVARDIKDVLSKTLGEYGIDVVDVSVENYDFSAEYEAAIATKSVIEQQILAAKLNAQKAEQEGQANVIAANKAAEVRRIEAQQDEKNLQFYALQIQHAAVNKWSGNLPQYVGGNTPLFNIPLGR